MGAIDYQFGIKDESSFNVPVVVDRFYEYQDNPAPIKGVAGRTSANPLRVGSRVRRSDRQVPYFDHAEGTVDLDVLTKGMGIWLKHMLGTVVTAGSGPYTHTATVSTLKGKSFTGQLNYPFTPSGTNQPVTFSGGKVLSWTIANSVDDMLSLSLNTWFASMATGTALATASYPSAMANMAWVHGAVTIGGTSVDIDSISIEGDNGYNTDKSKKLGTTRREPLTNNEMSIGWNIECDFSSLAQWNRVHALTGSGILAEITGTWSDGVNSLAITMPACSFDDIDLGGDPGEIMQTLTGAALYDGTNSPITMVYTSADSVA